jgi:hypothetical protein
MLGFTVRARDRIERSGLGVPIDLVYLDLGGTVGRLSQVQRCRHRLGPKGSRDQFKGGDLRPKRLPHRTQAVVPVNRPTNDKSGDLLSCRGEVD